MTRTRKILKLLAEGPALTVEEMSEHLGMPVKSVRISIAEMRQRGYIESRPSTYVITDVGHSWHKTVPKTSAEEFARRVIKNRQNRQRREAQTTTDYAIRKVPNSVFALGSM